MLCQYSRNTPMVVSSNIGVNWIYLMTVLSSSYVIILDNAINATGNGNNVVEGLNSRYNCYFKSNMELIGK